MKIMGKAILLLLVVCCSSCGMLDVSTTVNYQVEKYEPVIGNSNIKIGVRLFDDKRTWISGIKENKEGYYSSDQGIVYPENALKKYGITYDNQEFMPANRIVQDILVREISSLGYFAEKANSSTEYNYVVEGLIIAFQADKSSGFGGPAKARPIASITIGLKDSQGNVVMEAKKYYSSDPKHSMWVNTLAERLLNVVLRKAVAEFKKDLNVALK